MKYTSYQQFNALYNKGFSYLPISMSKRIEQFNPMEVYKGFREQSEYHFLLESGKIGQYTYLGGDPLYVVKGKDHKTVITHRDGKKEELTGNPIEALKGLMKKFHVPKLKEYPKFFGGAVGYLSYDMAKYFEKLPNSADDDTQVPDLYFMIMDHIWAFDHYTNELYYISMVQVREQDDLKHLYDTKLIEMKQLWNEWIKPDRTCNEPDIIQGTVDRSAIMTSFSEEAFIEAVQKIQAYISQGDVFQVNLSVRQSRQLITNDLAVYRHLRRINPSPYMGLMHFADLQLVSASPELLIEIKDKTIQTRPIAGTRPRGRDKEEDEQLVQELLNNEKEIAEHVMLVDLERNDLGRVSKYGSVNVKELMVVEKYSHVMHIVSHIVGNVDDNYDMYDCIKATFPGGTITGAPKIRTMEIIEELEPVKRGTYTGSMGWIGFQGDLELNILIRTLLMKAGKGYIQAGAGIVIDSIPKNEYIESLNKAEALWRAVESSEKEQAKEHSS